MQQNIEFERCIDFLVRMIDKYGEEVLRELEEEKQNKEEKTAQNTSFHSICKTVEVSFSQVRLRVAALRAFLLVTGSCSVQTVAV